MKNLPRAQQIRKVGERTSKLCEAPLTYYRYIQLERLEVRHAGNKQD
jgi:hypothetical protein